jgi:formate hydrogenlyase subunit 3/multisubunit Na+/H+ antiporter MnhD subunit
MWFGVGLGVILLSGVAACVFDRRPTAADRLFRWGAIAGCLLALVPAVARLLGAPPGAPLAAGTAGTSGWFAIDALSAWFLLVVLGVGAAIAAYGVPYLARERGPRRVGVAHLLLAVLIAGMAGIVTARTVVAFLLTWEVMALAAYFLVIFEHEKRETWDAGMLYLVLTHVSTLALIGMFAAWAGGHAWWRFEDLAYAAGQGWAPVSLVLALGLIGFGIKAGAVPFHFWLPAAHAAAPSHVSALLSGVVLKMGIYGLFRMLALLGAPPAWWGWTVLCVGLVSAVLGVLWALAQHDLKRLLAYHSVENVGIILLGVGLGALGTTYHQPALALLGYGGALLHALNHALFKSLLFLGAGALVRHTGTREIDRMGGLARRMPRTALAFLIGSAAIVGLPPLNGFVSEWLIFRGLLGTGVTSGNLRVAAAAAVGLALTGALALACFSKLFGVVFLGAPRDASVGGRTSQEAEGIGPQWILAAGCVAIGVAPALVVPLAVASAELLVPEWVGGDPLGAIGAGRTLSALAAALLAALGLFWVGRMSLAGRRRASSSTWGCAYPATSARAQYTASSFASPLLVTFGPVSGVREVRSATSFQTHASDPVLEVLGLPLWNRIASAAIRLRQSHGGGVRRYLLYSILCLLCLLVYLRLLAMP